MTEPNDNRQATSETKRRSAAEQLQHLLHEEARGTDMERYCPLCDGLLDCYGQPQLRMKIVAARTADPLFICDDCAIAVCDLMIDNLVRLADHAECRLKTAEQIADVDLPPL